MAVAETEEEFSFENTLGAILGVGLVFCAIDPSCVVPGAGNSSYSLTGGPYWDWDIFPMVSTSVGQSRLVGFAEHYHCDGMPMDDDRWP